MKTITSLALVALGLASPSAAFAGANKTWVSGSGVDSGTCAISAPCKSFQYALAQTSTGGEIDVKDSGGYGPVVVTKAISISAAVGVLATISVPAGGTGISVMSDNVVLSGLTIDGHSIGSTGIYVAGATLIANCNVRNLSTGIYAYGGGSTGAMLVSSTLTGNGVALDYRSQGKFVIAISKNKFTLNSAGVVLRDAVGVSTTNDNLFGANKTNFNFLDGDARFGDGAEYE